MKKILIISLLFHIMLSNIAQAKIALTGRILLQVEEKGEAWYVNPVNLERYYLGKPADAFSLMRKLGLGITNVDLDKITVANQKNSITADKSLSRRMAGRILLQVQSHGEAWYVDPVTQKRYFLGRPDDAFQIMRTLGLGITDADLEKITISPLSAPIPMPTSSNVATATAENVLQSAAAAIRAADMQATLTYFTANMQKSVAYSMQNMSKENLLILANILAGSTLQSSTENKKTYFNEVYFQNKEHPVYFYVAKQADGKWLMTNL